jgi:hypothetical protein
MSGDHNANQKLKSFMDNTNKDTKIEFAPGCFDDFEGTQEELDEMIAAIKQMMENGTLFENSTEVPPEDAEAIWKRVEAKSNTKKN